MLFAFMLFDAPDVAAIRQRVAAEHKACLAAVADRIAFAGPLFGDDDKSPAGSLLVIDFPDRAAALAWQRDEPFSRAGVYGTVRIHAFENRWPQKVGFPAG